MTARARAEHPLPLSEADWQRRVMDAAKAHGWRVVHVRAARVGVRHVTPYEGDPGLPDLVLARDGVVLLAELKADKAARWQPGQREWLAAAGKHGHAWQPKDWDRVLEVLA